MKIELENKLGTVDAVIVYGKDETIYRVARVCTGNGFNSEPSDKETLNRFITNLIKRQHLRCFEFCGIVFGIRCPIFVERQLRTYRKPELERSLRYCEPIEETIDGDNTDALEIQQWNAESLRLYRKLRAKGVPKEEARRVLPLDTLTEVVSFYTLRSLFHVFDERLSARAQSETSKVVQAMHDIAKEFFPLSIRAYDYSRNANGDKE